MLRYYLAIICKISRIPACASCGHFYDVPMSLLWSLSPHGPLKLYKFIAMLTAVIKCQMKISFQTAFDEQSRITSHEHLILSYVAEENICF
ncbi:hypothetical protein Syun_026110 [Stephania yunnanensis]|uniref:Uncharacterized protein n=1 Tax=Stephania yunnanensis TaxID=152371 RepID=A0AAP0EVJ5_9MAGN